MQAPGDAAALTGRVVLVVGAHGGLGAAASRACARAGAEVVLLGRRIPKLNRLLDAIAAEGGKASAYPLDLEGASPEDLAEMTARIEAAHGRLDGVLHCAAEFRGLTPLAMTDPADFARAVHVNLTARWWLTQACLPLLSAREDAAAVFAIDDPQARAGAYWGGYGIAQQAQSALVAMLEAELRNTPVRVAVLRPGPMRTPLRARAWAEDVDPSVRDPAAFAGDCVRLLAGRDDVPGADAATA